MDEKPRIVRLKPRSSSKSAILIALGVAVGVQVALCAVLVAIHYQEWWLPSIQKEILSWSSWLHPMRCLKK